MANTDAGAIQTHHVRSTYLIDEDYAAFPLKQSENRPIFITVGHGEVIAEGNLAGHTALGKYGHNTDVGTSWETVYHGSNLKTHLASAERLQIASDDVDDDGSPLGNGARTVLVSGQGDDRVVISETVVMNGTTNVLTDASFIRPSLSIVTAGDSQTNEGTITASNNADDTVLAQIEPGEGESHCACYSVPAGHTAYVDMVIISEVSTKGSEFGVFVRPFGGLWKMKTGIALIDSAIPVKRSIPLPLPEKTDMEIRAKGILAGANVTAVFMGWVEEN